MAFVEIDGIRCYAPALADDCADYPADGFDLSATLEADSFWCRSRNRIIRDVIERFGDRSRRLAMLEIGCGIGGVVAELRRLANLDITASEIYLQGLKFARARFPDVQFIQLDATAMPFRGDFDIVGAFDVLEHIGADEQAIAGVHQALRSTGLFIVTVPQYQWMWSPLDDAVRHKRRYGRRELEGKLRAAGFDVVFSSSFVTMLFPAMLMSRMIARSGKRQASSAETLASMVTLPRSLNRVFDTVMRADEALLRGGVTLPFGGSLLAVARKR